jgi:hypothetical protein
VSPLECSRVPVSSFLRGDRVRLRGLGRRTRRLRTPLTSPLLLRRLPLQPAVAARSGSGRSVASRDQIAIRDQIASRTPSAPRARSTASPATRTT